jgi:hypothetical protein
LKGDKSVVELRRVVDFILVFLKLFVVILCFSFIVAGVLLIIFFFGPLLVIVVGLFLFCHPGFFSSAEVHAMVTSGVGLWTSLFGGAEQPLDALKVSSALTIPDEVLLDFCTHTKVG